MNREDLIMSKADKEILTAIRNRRDLERPMVSVRGLLKQVDRENYLDMCCSRLADSELLDGEDACIDFTDFPNIELSADGLQSCKSILECYISRDLLAQVYGFTCRTERMNCAINNYAEILRGMTAFQLLKAHLGMKPGEDAAVYIRAELWSRFIFAAIVRKVQYGCTKLYVHIKYHRIFRAARNAVAEGIL